MYLIVGELEEGIETAFLFVHDSIVELTDPILEHLLRHCETYASFLRIFHSS